MNKILKNQLVYFNLKLPSPPQLIKILTKTHKVACHEAKSYLVICDKHLQSVPTINKWLKNYSYYLVSSGEDLKELKHLHKHIQKILKKMGEVPINGFISLGGGTVGDFAGFLASVFHRGKPLIHIPSTWLAAMDSAHGGKTALNNYGIKNIIGSYYPPTACFIIKNLFASLKSQNISAAGGELLKTAFIQGGKLYLDVKTYNLDPTRLLWQCLPQVILSKLKIVKKDPMDKLCIRKKLNFGHTIGHILESHFRLPHGIAILYGMAFAIRWSHYRLKRNKVNTLTDLAQIDAILSWQKDQKIPVILSLNTLLKKIPLAKFKTLLMQDKKRINTEEIHFIFIKKHGQVFVKKVHLLEILKEKQRQIKTVLI